MSPATMKGNISGLKRFFKDWWGYVIDLINQKHRIVGNVEGGLWTILENRVRFIKAKGEKRKPHNILSKHDVRILLKSSELDG